MLVEAVYLPRRLVEEARKRGIDIEDIVLQQLARVLDPPLIAEARIEMAERYLGEAREYLRRGDAVQASEKLYKAVEECIKALAEAYGLPEAEKARREGRWWTQLLGKAARRLARLLREPQIVNVWARAYDVHVWGFHEAKYTVEDIEGDVDLVEWIVRYARRVVEAERRAGP